MSIADEPFEKLTASPLVDVVIAAYNAAATIGEAVRSALAQPEAASVVVVDDASDDETCAVATANDDGSQRLKILRQEQNGGPSRARNRGLAASSAEWFTVLDADDVMLPGRLGVMLSHSASADLVADDLLVYNQATKERRAMFLPPITSPQYLDAVAFIQGNISHGRESRRDLGFIKPLVRRELLVRQKLRFDEGLWLGEDYELYARLLLRGARMIIVPAAGYVYTIRATSLSGSHSISALQMLRDCDRQLAQIPDLDIAQRKALDNHYLSVDSRVQWRILIEAFKSRDTKAAAATFSRSIQVSWFLVTMLFGEAIRRTKLILKA